MPGQLIFPEPDRGFIFDNGKNWDDWLDSGDDPSNAEKMRGRYRSITLDQWVAERLLHLPDPVKIIAIAESWCGDVVRQVPLLVKMVHAANGRADVRFISRNDHPEFFIRFLTNGGEAIPKFIFCSNAFNEVGNFGPMPSTPRKYIAMGKSIGDVEADRLLVRKFYKRDGYKESIHELLELFELAALREIPTAEPKH